MPVRRQSALLAAVLYVRRGAAQTAAYYCRRFAAITQIPYRNIRRRLIVTMCHCFSFAVTRKDGESCLLVSNTAQGQLYTASLLSPIRL